MLRIEIKGTENWDEEKEEFVYEKGSVIALEHSLVSVSKWEARWHKPFLSKEEKTTDEIIDYVKCMTITQNVSDETYYRLSEKNFKEINNYIEDTMTATWFAGTNQSHSREQITSELIYYWMIALNIPVEFQKWHLNRLLTLIRVCNIKNTPPKKMSRRQLLNRNAELNASRRSIMNSKG